MLADQKRHLSKVLPEISFEKIAPPYPKYHYFQGVQDYPFRPGATGFDLVNAWWLIEACILSYSEEDLVRKKFKLAGLKEVKYFGGASTQCFVAHNEAFLILVFRGTEARRRPGRTDFGNILADVLADADIRLDGSGQVGQVHRGFKEALDEVWKEDLLTHLKSKEGSGRTFWFTGHSLGAAVATLAAQRYGQVHGLYTYGSPRVGDLDFQQDFKVPTYRFVNNKDIVTRVPPLRWYHHVGHLKFIDGQGLIHEAASGEEDLAEALPAELDEVMEPQIRTGLGHIIPQVLVDHVPLIYATHIWNSIP
jgi:triacylglycerol lipase